MRLSKFEQNIIKQTAEQIFGIEVKVFIFGSRINDNLKGGDIDIYIEVSKDNVNLLEKKIKFLVGLDDKLGEQKIDVVINSGQKNNRPIFQLAKANGVQL
jgi:predicted nucleotidyltransferase